MTFTYGQVQRKYGKLIALWLLIVIFYFFALLAYGKIQKMEGVPVYFSSYYPDTQRARGILESEQAAEEPRGVCFYWDGGTASLEDPLQGRRAEALFGAVLGDAVWYDSRANAFTSEDTKGCIMDENTASRLFRGADPVGRNVRINGEMFQVRRVLPWKQNLVLVAKPESGRTYTKIFLQVRSGESRKNAVTAFLNAYGLEGRSTNERYGYAFALLLFLPVSLLVKLTARAVREKRAETDKKRRFVWSMLLLLLGVFVMVFLWKEIELPREWIPGKWSDFEFFSGKWTEIKEDFQWYLMMPKTVLQVENFLWAGISAFFSILSFLLFSYSCVDSRHPGEYDGTKRRWRYDLYNQKNKNKRRDS